MLRLSEFMTQGGLFESVNAIKPMPFLDDGQSEVMDRLLILQYGDRSMFTKMITVSLPEIARMAVMTYGDRWDGIIKLNAIDGTVGKKRVVVETITNVEKKLNTRDEKSLVSAFNADALIVDNGLTANTNDDSNSDTNRTMTDETIDFKTAYNNLSLTDKNNIMNIVLKDIADLITLNIY